MSLRFDVVISFLGGHDCEEWIRQCQRWLSGFSLLPHLMKALSNDASTEMGVQLPYAAQGVSIVFSLNLD